MKKSEIESLVAAAERLRESSVSMGEADIAQALRDIDKGAG